MPFSNALVTFSLITITLAFPLLAHGADATKPAADSAYPSKPVRLVVPFGAGGTDTVARVTATQLSTRLDKRVIVENRPGAGGVIGMEYVAKADPDGYVLLFTSPSISISPWLYKLSFDPMTAFIPVGKTGTGPIVLTIHPSLPVKSVKEMIALAKKRPGQLLSSSSGVGSFTHLATELFKQTAQVDILVVQYKGGSEGLLSLLTGDTHLGFNAVTSSMPHIRSARMRALATGGSTRSELLPDIPTVAEAGLPGYEASTWNGILAPARTPQPIVDRLYSELRIVMNSDEVRKAFENQGASVDLMNSAEFREFIRKESGKWEKVVRNIPKDATGKR
jgi:tripartite-type tricarboxylate transporter receptor subunit TctC